MTFHDNCGPVSLGFQPASGYYASGMTTLDSVLVLKVTHVKDKRARRRRRLSFFLHLLWMVRNLWLTKFISNMTKLLRRLPVFSFVSPISFSFNYLWNIERSRVYLPYIELPALYPFIQIELNPPPKITVQLVSAKPSWMCCFLTNSYDWMDDLNSSQLVKRQNACFIFSSD